MLQFFFMFAFTTIAYLLFADVVYVHYLSYDSFLVLFPLSSLYGYILIATLFNFLAASAISPGFTETFP